MYTPMMCILNKYKKNLCLIDVQNTQSIKKIQIYINWSTQKSGLLEQNERIVSKFIYT